MRKILYIVVTTVIASSIAFAQAPPPPPPPADNEGACTITASTGRISSANLPAPSVIGALRTVTLATYPMLETRLKLTDEQKNKIKEMFVQADKAAEPKIMAQRVAAKAFADGIAAGIDDADLLKLGGAATAAEGAVLTERVKALCNLRKILNADQNKDLTSMLERVTMPWRGAAIAEPTPTPADKPAK